VIPLFVKYVGGNKHDEWQPVPKYFNEHSVVFWDGGCFETEGEQPDFTGVVTAFIQEEVRGILSMSSVLSNKHVDWEKPEAWSRHVNQSRWAGIFWKMARPTVSETGIKHPRTKRCLHKVT